MEGIPRQNIEVRPDKFASDFHMRVDFLFQRRKVPRSYGGQYGELSFGGDDDEIEFVTSAFTENYIDAPESIEIKLLGSIEYLDDHHGVLVVTYSQDHDSLYTTMYDIHIDDGVSTMTKDVRRVSKYTGPNERGLSNNVFFKNEIIFEDVPLAESELKALAEMIERV